MGRGARLEYEDAQVWVCRRKTACDDATGSAACGTSSLSEECGSVGKKGVKEDGAPPAKMMSYSSLIWVGVDILPLLG